MSPHRPYQEACQALERQKVQSVVTHLARLGYARSLRHGPLTLEDLGTRTPALVLDNALAILRAAVLSGAAPVNSPHLERARDARQGATAKTLRVEVHLSMEAIGGFPRLVPERLYTIKDQVLERAADRGSATDARRRRLAATTAAVDARGRSGRCPHDRAGS